MKNYNWIILSIIFFLLTTSSVSLAEEMEDKPIASVFDRFIYNSDLLPEKEILDRYRANLSKDEFDQWEQENQNKALEALIHSALQEQLMVEMGMVPTENEIQLFIDFSLKQEETRLEEFQSQRDNLLKELQAEGLEESKRTSLSDHLKTLDQLIEYDLKRQEEVKSIPNYAQIKENSFKRIATMTVTSWKFNKALYDKYGGRVIFQQAGYEPMTKVPCDANSPRTLCVKECTAALVAQ